jgi:hypothetical protein
VLKKSEQADERASNEGRKRHDSADIIVGVQNRDREMLSRVVRVGGTTSSPRSGGVE